MQGEQVPGDRASAALARAPDLTEIGQVVRTAARRIADAQGATFVLRDADDCFYADEDAIAPLWKGQRFPMTHCISGWAMLYAATTVVPDIEVDDRIPLEAYRPTFVRSLVAVPIGGRHPVGASGAYWSERLVATEATVAGLEQLAEPTAAAIDRVGLESAPWAPTLGSSHPRLA